MVSDKRLKEYIELSRSAALVRNRLEPGLRIRFTEAVRGAKRIGDVPLPYREWVADPSSIPKPAMVGGSR